MLNDPSMGTQFLLKIKDMVSFGLKEQFWFSHPESDQTGQAPSPTFVEHALAPQKDFVRQNNNFGSSRLLWKCFRIAFFCCPTL